MSFKDKNTNLYILLLILGCGSQVIMRIFQSANGIEFLTMVWIYAFLDLICRFRSKKQLIITGIFFSVGFSLKFAGSTGHFFADLALFAILGLVVYGAFLICARFICRFDSLVGTLFFPAFWTVGYLCAYALGFPSLVRVDMMFSNMKILIHAVHFFGTVGFSCLILWIVSLLRYGFSHHKNRYVMLSCVIFLLLLLPGTMHMYPNITATKSLKAAYAMGPYIGTFTDYEPISYEENVASLQKSVKDAATLGAEILVFNEEAFEITDSDAEPFILESSALAKEHSLALLVGLDITSSTGGKSINELVLINPDGEIINTYEKSHLFPFIETDYEPGDGIIHCDRLNLNGKDVKIAYIICYDSNFPDFINDMDDDTDILFLPSWDWGAVTELHSRLCTTIAVENNIYILKPTYDGITIAVSPDGEIFHKSSTAEIGYETVQVVDIPIRSSIVLAEEQPMKSPFVYTIIGTSILSILVLIILFLGNNFINVVNSRRSMIFNVILLTGMIACGAIALSRLLDGHVRLSSIVYLTSIVSHLMKFVLPAEFVLYVYEYFREKQKASGI